VPSGMNIFLEGIKWDEKNTSMEQLGMQAGRVLPQARWASPRRKPVKCRNSARINEAGLRGCPTGPSGAAEPAKKEVRDREGGFEGRGGGAAEAVRLRASAARSSHGIAVRLSAVATNCRRVHAFPTQPRSLLRLRAHGHGRTIR